MLGEASKPPSMPSEESGTHGCSVRSFPKRLLDMAVSVRKPWRFPVLQDTSVGGLYGRRHSQGREAGVPFWFRPSSLAAAAAVPPDMPSFLGPGIMYGPQQSSQPRIRRVESGPVSIQAGAENSASCVCNRVVLCRRRSSPVGDGWRGLLSSRRQIASAPVGRGPREGGDAGEGGSEGAGECCCSWGRARGGGNGAVHAAVTGKMNSLPT